MNESTDFSAMFEMDADDFIEQSKESVMYKVSPKNGKNGVYSALVRFIPWYQNPKESLVDKWEAWLENPLTKKGMTIDCPSSVRQPSELQDIYWKLKKSNSPQLQDKAKFFSRRRKFYAIVQIVKDENNPSLEGKLKIWKFGVKIHDKIQAELKPEFGTPHVPFDPFSGKLFHIKCKEVAGYANYDESKFLDQPTGVLVDGQMLQSGQEAQLVEYLKENSPNLDDFKFRPWTPEQKQHFDEMVSVIVPNSEKASNLRAPVTSEETSQEDPKDSESEQPESPGTTPGMNFDFDDL